MEIWEILLDSFLDALKVLGICFVIYVILSFVENRMTKFLIKHKKTTPITASLFGLIPQCGFSVVASDLYIKEHITVGALFAAFFACSDEALPIMFSDLATLPYVLPLLLIKLVIGFSAGYLIDIIVKPKKTIEMEEELSHECHIGCCHHDIDHDHSKIKNHLIHPLIHSLKIFLYVFIVSFLFGLLVYFVKEENLTAFLTASKWFTPIFSSIIGLIPNCSASALLTEVFASGGIPFGALVAGLCVNAGLGIIYLLKNKDKRKNALYLLLSLFVLSVIVGYAVMGICELF